MTPLTAKLTHEVSPVAAPKHERNRGDRKERRPDRLQQGHERAEHDQRGPYEVLAAVPRHRDQREERGDGDQVVGEQQRAREVIPKAAHRSSPFDSCARIVALLVIGFAGLFHITAAEAAAPTVVANGSTQGITSGNTFAANIGSPSAGDLVVLYVDCYNLNVNAAISLSTPSGWTAETLTNHASSDTFGDQAVYWKQASGSEGATVSFSISNTTTECSAWYWRLTGYNTSDAADATDIAWAISATQDPPSQSFASAPRDAVVLGIGTSRGDNTWSSGPSGLTNTAHSDAGGSAAGRSIAVGWDSFTSTSSKDPGTITFSGTTRIGSAVTVVVYGAAASAASFDSGPTFAKVDNNTVRMTYDTANATTAYVALYPLGTSDPSAATLIAGTGAHGTANESATNASDTLDVDATDSPAFPAYKVCGVAAGAGGNSAVTCNSSVALDPPSGYQYVTLSSVAIGSPFSVATLGYHLQTANFVVGETVTDGNTGATAVVLADTDNGSSGTLTLWVASGSFINASTLTGSINGVAVNDGTPSFLYAANDIVSAPTTVSPSGQSLTIGVDGTASYSGATGRQSALDISIYHNATGWLPSDVDWTNNNASPSCGGQQNFTLVKGDAISAIDLDNFCGDPEFDVLTSVAVQTQPTGLSLNGTTNVVSGTPTVDGTTLVRYVVYDPFGAVGYQDVNFTIVDVVTAQSPDCVSTPTTFSDCEDSYSTVFLNTATFSVTPLCSASVANGNVIATSPPPLAELPQNPNVAITYSVGTCPTHPIPMVNCLKQTLTACQTLITDAFGALVTLSSTEQCPAGYPAGKIVSQSPKPGRPTTTPTTLAVGYCP